MQQVWGEEMESLLVHMFTTRNGAANIQSNVQVLIRQNLNLSTEELNKGSLIKSGGPGFALNEHEKKGS
jgi:hypothetical protein